jgi:GT2 family glycosyltransferase/glycosyltransferase involved in cell wall biosynthesis
MRRTARSLIRRLRLVLWPENARIEHAIRHYFDQDFYKDAYPEVLGQGLSPIQHFIRIGWREGLDPNPLFSTRRYLKNNPDVARSGDNPLLHYVRHGRKEGRLTGASDAMKAARISASGAKMSETELRHIELSIEADFDEKFYREAYPDAVAEEDSALRHYILRGWREGLDPNPLFSTRQYLARNPDVATLGSNPLLHYVESGRKEGRFTGFSEARKPIDELVVPEIPLSAEYWSALDIPRPTHSAQGPVDIVIPVYKGLEHVAACIHSVLLAPNETPVDIIVINDNSPDPKVTDFLEMLKAAGLITLITNTRNLGFIGTINLGAALHPDRDVLFLNSDAMVFGNYIDRLFRIAKQHSDIATITPLTNNGTICSYPEADKDNAFELELLPDRLDALAAEVNGDTIFDIPTGVSYCMFVTRRAIDNVGPFDAEAFGVGYGEENDFSCRAAQRGWRNVLAPGIYVRHFGSVSFGAEMSERAAKAQEIVKKKHPGYQARVERYNQADPALPARVLLDAARLREAIGPISVLFLTHSWGGGVDTYFKHIRFAMRADGQQDIVDRALVARTHRSGYLALEAFGDCRVPFTPNLLALNLDRHRSWLAELLDILDPQLIHVNSFAGLSLPSIRGLIEAVLASKRPFWHVWHDHQPLCPRLQFIDSQEKYCGEADVSLCRTCLASRIVSEEWVDIGRWRAMFTHYLARAELISVPVASACERAKRLCAPERIEVQTHPEPFLQSVDPLDGPRRRREGEPLRVVTLGAIGPHKGAHLIAAMADDAEARKLPITFDIVGFTSNPGLAEHPKVTVHGRYAGDSVAIEMLGDLQPDLFLITSIWPETHMFTLSIAMALGLPVLASDLGAQGERTRGYARGATLSADLIRDPRALNDALLATDIAALWARPMGDLGFHVRSPFRGVEARLRAPAPMFAAK